MGLSDDFGQTETEQPAATHISDFTTAHYAELLQLAKASYRFVSYEDAREGKTILWRHDCDISLNRAHRLAMIENDNSVMSTFFLNPHSEFYNLLEKKQTSIIKEIVSLGHRIGLHFDAEYYELKSENDLSEHVRMEAEWLGTLFGTGVAAFSFHNPTDLLLEFDRDTYGGLVNCYSKSLRATVPYCSDSNGTWRFKRLWNVLKSASDPHLHILTHPEWWQETPMHPRERITRSVDGRAKAVLDSYDKLLEKHARPNHTGEAERR